ncbi:MAG TPA: hypothetical protein VME67_20865 [Mycobacterium sp.]|nr:hypothetical protein [Mycobacterium sp.]HTX97072.1 hypothetical protein [Mycobacterium sp.]
MDHRGLYSGLATDCITIAAGSPDGDVAATAVLVRPDGYVAMGVIGGRAR